MWEPRNPAPPLIRQVPIAGRGYRRGGQRRSAGLEAGVDPAAARSQPASAVPAAGDRRPADTALDPARAEPRSRCCAPRPAPAPRGPPSLALPRRRRRRAPARLADPADQGPADRPRQADRLDGRGHQARGDGRPPGSRARARLPGVGARLRHRSARRLRRRAPRPGRARGAHRAARRRLGRARGAEGERADSRSCSRPRATPTPRSASSAAGPTPRSTAAWRRAARGCASSGRWTEPSPRRATHRAPHGCSTRHSAGGSGSDTAFSPIGEILRGRCRRRMWSWCAKA